MRQTKFALALLASAILAGCGGSTPGPQTLKNSFTSQVTFGDSLADVGTYNVGAVKAAGGGKYTINGDNTATNIEFTGKNWTELLAAQLGVAAPCAAMTGLDGDATKGFSVPVQTFANCYGYAQGGARVTNPIGSSHKLTGAAIGQLTVPAVTQVANHLAKTGGSFSGKEHVIMMIGGNDALAQASALFGGAQAAGAAAGAAEGAKVGNATFASTLIGLLAAGATNPATAAQAIGLAFQTEAARPGATQTTMVGAAVGAAAIQPGNSAVASATVYGPMVAKATADATTAGNTAGAAAGAKAGADFITANTAKAVAEMAKAGDETVALVKTQILAKGANFVTVVNLGDFASVPAGKNIGVQFAPILNSMVDAFNAKLTAGLGSESKVLIVDLFSISHDQVLNPAPYGLTNTSTPACTVASLLCTKSTLISGDVSKYMFADDIHVTPYEYRLVAQYVAEKMILKGWL
jgi:outer membrane lipase/esterase